jgi:hypothetical protein
VASVIEVTDGSKVIVPPSQTFVSIASRRVAGPLSALLVTTTAFEHDAITCETAFEVLPLKVASPL